MSIPAVVGLAMVMLGGCSALEPKPRPTLTARAVVGTWVHEDRKGHRSEITFSDSGEFFGSNIPQKAFDYYSYASTQLGFGDDLNWKVVGDFSGSWKIDENKNGVWITIEGGTLSLRGRLPLDFDGARGVQSLGREVGSPDDFNRFDFYRVLSDD